MRTEAKRMSIWQALQFVWHYRYRHPSHGEGTYYDETVDVVRCPCGKTWPPR